MATLNKITILAAFFISLFATVNLAASVLTVTKVADTDDDICNSDCSLREAIKVAAPDDTVIFDRSLRGGVIELTKSLFIDKRITIDGPNKRRITLKGNFTFRIIEIKGGVVSIDGLVIRDGQETNGDGGGIYVNPASFATLNLTNIAVLNNTTQHGGGIYMTFGTLYLFDSTIAGNTSTADTSGGGIDLTRTNNAYIWYSTLSGNIAKAALDTAGGIRIAGSSNWSIRGSTIAYNISNGQTLQSAGGLVALNGIPATFFNTIIAKNTGINPDIYGRTAAAINCFFCIADPRNGFADGKNGNIVGTTDAPADPLLSILGDNGGNIPTHMLLSGSRAIDAGKNDAATDR